MKILKTAEVSLLVLNNNIHKELSCPVALLSSAIDLFKRIPEYTERIFPATVFRIRNKQKLCFILIFGCITFDRSTEKIDSLIFWRLSSHVHCCEVPILWGIEQYFMAGISCELQLQCTRVLTFGGSFQRSDHSNRFPNKWSSHIHISPFTNDETCRIRRNVCLHSTRECAVKETDGGPPNVVYSGRWPLVQENQADGLVEETEFHELTPFGR